jgi:predicted ATPase
LYERFVLITGCSGSGKSTLLSELSMRGHRVVEEPGRRIVKDQLQTAARALPWVNELAFTRLAIATALADRETAKTAQGWVFFDRGLIDAASALQRLTGQPVLSHIRITGAFSWLRRGPRSTLRTLKDVTVSKPDSKNTRAGVAHARL